MTNLAASASRPGCGLASKWRPEDRADQVEAEEADPPEADDAGEGQQHADDGVAPPARVAEELGHRAELVLAAVARRPRPRRPCQRSGSLS